MSGVELAGARTAVTAELIFWSHCLRTIGAPLALARTHADDEDRNANTEKNQTRK
jgi:hypothetical protein